LVETYLASLPGGNRVENWRDVSYNYPSGAIEKALYRGQEPKSLNTIDFTGSFEWTLENRYKAEAMLDVLRIKLRDRIREDMGGTYGVRIRGDFDRYPRQQYKITISFGANPERVEELTQEIFNQIDSLRSFGTSETNLQKVKEMHRREYETNLKENGYWMSALRLRYQNNLDPADIIRDDEKIDQLTLADIQEAARKYLNPENYVRVVLYPEDWAKE
jgi:zinc protease